MSTEGKVARAVKAIDARLGERSVAALYRDRVRSLRTRRYSLNAPARAKAIEIQRTLLGIELKIGRRRLLCPDVATARFLAVFARLGVTDVAVPYDITQINRLAQELENARAEAMALIEAETEGMPPQTRGKVVAGWLASQRDAITAAGAGPMMPQFDQSTRQRRRR